MVIGAAKIYEGFENLFKSGLFTNQWLFAHWRYCSLAQIYQNEFGICQIGRTGQLSRNSSALNKSILVSLHNKHIEMIYLYRKMDHFEK